MSERKHIKLECQKVFGDNVAFRIVEQTHRNKAFGSEGNTYKASNGATLKSYDYPQWVADFVVLYVWGREITRDNLIVFASLADFKLIADAIREYNKTFSGEETTVVMDSGTFFVE